MRFLRKLGVSVPDLLEPKRGFVCRYGVAFLAVAIAFIIRYLLNPVLGNYAPFILFVPAIIASAWYGGLFPALLATLGTFVLADFYFVAPASKWSLVHTHELIATAVYVFTAFSVAGLMEALRREQRRTTERAEMLRAEVEQRKQAEATLRESEEKYRSLYLNTPVMLHSIDPEGRLLSVSNFWLNSLGYTSEEVLGRKSVDFLTPQSQQYARDVVIPEFFKTGVCVNVPYQMVKKDGTIIEVLLSAIAEKDENGNVIRSLAVSVDVTAQKLAEQALRASEQRLRVLANTAVDAIISADGAGKVIQFNPAAERIFGYTASEMIGNSFLSIMPPPLRERCRAGFIRFTETGRATLMGRTTEMVGLRKDGTEFPVEISLSSWETPDGRFFTAIARDVTERKQAEEALRQNEELLRITTEGAGVGLWSWDVTHDVLEWNSVEYQQTALRTDAEMRLQTFLDRVHPDDRDRVKETMETCLRERCELTMEYRVVWPDGTVRWRLCKGTPAYVEDQPVRFSGMSMDITLRKQAEEALRQNEELLRITTEGANIDLWTWDARRDVLECPRAREVFGHSEGETLRLNNFFDHLHPDDHATIKNEVENCLRNGLELNVEYRVVRPDGSVCWRQSKGSPTFADGRLVRLSGMSMDITLRKQAEEALRQSEELLRLTTEAAHIGLWNWDVTSNELKWNAIEYQQFGLSPQTPATLEMFFDGIHPEDRDWMKLAVNRCLHENCELNVEHRILRPDGSIRWVNCRGRPHFSGDRPVRFSGMSLDTTEQRNAQEILRQQNELLKLAQVLAFDFDDKILFWNPGAERLYGWTREEAMGRDAHQLLRTEFPEPLEQIKEKVIARGSWEGELNHYRKDGEKICIASHWALFRDRENRAVSILESNNNISRLKQAEAALAEAKEAIARHAENLEVCVAERTSELQRSLKDMESFCYTIAHDLRAPLRAMSGFSYSLAEDFAEKIGPVGIDYCQRINAASARMSQLISDLLVYGRLSHAELPMKSVDLLAEINRVLERTAQLIEERNAEIKVEKPLPKVCGDAPLIDQILENLLSNAVKFVPPDRRPRVHIFAENRDGNVRLCIEDNGIGIPQEHWKKIFQPFERLHTVEYPGTGIGLAIVRRGVEKMGGQVGVESSPEHGSRFWVELPEQCRRE